MQSKAAVLGTSDALISNRYQYWYFGVNILLNGNDTPLLLLNDGSMVCCKTCHLVVWLQQHYKVMVSAPLDTSVW